MKNLLSEMRSRLKTFEIETITAANYKQLAGIYDTNEAFFLLTQGRNETVESCLKDIDAIPPGYSLEDKYFFACWINGHAAAVVETLIGVPSPDVMWIGFLLIHEEWKGRQNGRKIVNALLDSANALGISRFQLGVVKENAAGLAFWRKMGFIEIRETQIERPGGKRVRAVIMEK